MNDTINLESIRNMFTKMRENDFRPDRIYIPRPEYEALLRNIKAVQGIDTVISPVSIALFGREILPLDND